MKRSILYRLAGLLLSAMVLSGCANGKETEVAEQSAETEMTEVFLQAGEASEAGSSHKNKKAAKGTIRVATVGSPHTEILQQAALLLGEKGYEVKVEVCEDYLTPNQMLAEGKVDCNYYQHEAFLERYNIEHQTALAEVAKVHYEPLAIYSHGLESLEQVEIGMKIAISNNPTAVARALWLLQDVELIKLTSDADMNTVKDDITENPYKLEFLFVEETELAGKLQEADMVICNMDTLMQEAIDAEELFLVGEKEDGMMVQKLSHSVVAAEADSKEAKMLVDILLSGEMKQFVETKYQGSIVMLQDVASSDVEEDKVEE